MLTILIANFTSNYRKKSGWIFTPSSFNAHSQTHQIKTRCKDKRPTCGSGSLLIKNEEVGSDDFSLFGQEAFCGFAVMCSCMVLIMQYPLGDTIRNRSWRRRSLMKFDTVLQIPLFLLTSGARWKIKKKTKQQKLRPERSFQPFLERHSIKSKGLGFITHDWNHLRRQGKSGCGCFRMECCFAEATKEK